MTDGIKDDYCEIKIFVFIDVYAFYNVATPVLVTV